MDQKTEFFLGANSPSGFYSLYDELEKREQIKSLTILTGGPGVGKSTMMKAIGKRAEEEHLDVEYIRCSGDPDSLDAIILPEIHYAVADGTAPHILYPRYPVAVDRFLDLGRFYDVKQIRNHREEIIICSDEYRENYKKAYICMKARQGMLRQMEGSILENMETAHLEQRIQNIWLSRRGKKQPKRGGEYRRFLGGLTPQGRVCCDDTPKNLCNEIYVLRDSFHAASSILKRLQNRILQDGYDVITCFDSDEPERILHLFVPQYSLGIMTEDRSNQIAFSGMRRIRVDALLDSSKLRTMRGSLRFKKRLIDALEAEGQGYLSAAGKKHEELEHLYRPYVDFNGVSQATENELELIFG